MLACLQWGVVRPGRVELRFVAPWFQLINHFYWLLIANIGHWIALERGAANTFILAQYDARLPGFGYPVTPWCAHFACASISLFALPRWEFQPRPHIILSRENLS